MQIEDLPYPVCTEGSPDYLGALFFVNFEQTESEDPLHFAVRGEFNVQNEDLMGLIDSGKAGFGLFIECAQTDYYELRPCAKSFKENLIKAYFSDSVTITPVIYSLEEIEHYTNRDLIDELREQDITIPEGAVLAADSELIVTITRSQPQTVEAICKLKPSENPGYYDLEGDSILLYVPREVYDKYSKMTRNQKIQVTSIYFPPVLESILSNIFIDDMKEYADRMWYGSIQQALESRGINPQDYDAYQVMMSILGDFLIEGVMFIDTDGSVLQ